MATHTKSWANMAEFVDDIASKGGQFTQGWRGERFEEAKALAFYWPEGAAQVEAMRARLNIGSQRMRKEVQMSKVGPGTLNMGRYLAGHPEPWATLQDSTRAARGKGKIVRLAINVSVSGNISEEVIIRRGAAVLALAQALEQTGRRVEITVYRVMTMRRGITRVEQTVTVKRPAQKLNLNSVAFAVCHPEMLRTLFFAATDQDNRFSGYAGTPAEYNPEGTVMVPHANSLESRVWDSEETASEWVRKALVDQGVKVKG